MGKLAVIKTKQTELSVDDFLSSIRDEQKRKDSLTLLKMFKKISGEKPKIWGSSIIGFGKKIYKSPATGREVEWFKLGFSPRKANISLQLVIDVRKHSGLLKKFGKHKAGVGCLYINKLSDIDTKVLEKLVKEAVKGK